MLKIKLFLFFIVFCLLIPTFAYANIPIPIQRTPVPKFYIAAQNTKTPPRDIFNSFFVPVKDKAYLSLYQPSDGKDYSIYYTTNNQDPKTSGILYNGPIKADKFTLKAYSPGDPDSAILKMKFRADYHYFSEVPLKLTCSKIKRGTGIIKGNVKLNDIIKSHKSNKLIDNYKFGICVSVKIFTEGKLKQNKIANIDERGDWNLNTKKIKRGDKVTIDVKVKRKLVSMNKSYNTYTLIYYTPTWNNKSIKI